MSETTKREHKGQNRHVINWLERVDADRPFLFEAERVWTYGDAVDEMMSDKPDGVFGLLRQIHNEAQLVVHTSGTTGPPKAITLSMGNLEAAARASAEHLGHGPEDNWLLTMPLSHVGGMSIVVRQAYTGGSITMFPVFEPGAVAEVMHGPVTMVSVVPTMLRRLLAHGPFAGLRAVLVGGGPIPAGLLEEAAAVGMPVLPTYGMTETFGQVATLRPGATLAYETHPLPGVEIEIRDGRIAVRGDQVSRDVVDDDDWFVTNDLGQMGNGTLRVLGRADNLIISGGLNINPERIEAALAPFVDEVVVIGVPDDDWGEVVVCVFVGGVDVEEVASDLLHGAMKPKRFVRVEAIPKTAIGKPDRSAVKDLF